MSTCPCGLRPRCPNGQLPDQPLTCAIWEAHVQPKWWERAVGAVVAFLMGRW